jgi:hypothetical protein
MRRKLDKREVKKWLRGHKLASRLVEKERVRLLSGLTVEESANMYQLLSSSSEKNANRQHPSPVLLRMRKAVNAYAKLGRNRKA